jgi:uncharacterized protein (TIGR00251 family)
LSFKCITEGSEGVLFHVMASPRASRSEITGIYQDRCKIKIKAPPVDGEANEALIAFISKFFKLPKKQIVLQRGSTGKQKTFLLSGLTVKAATEALASVLAE